MVPGTDKGDTTLNAAVFAEAGRIQSQRPGFRSRNRKTRQRI